MLNTSDTNIPSIVSKIFGLKEPFDCDHLAARKMGRNQTDYGRGQNADESVRLTRRLLSTLDFSTVNTWHRSG